MLSVGTTDESEDDMDDIVATSAKQSEKTNVGEDKEAKRQHMGEDTK